MPKKYVIQKKQVKRYFKRNKQWLLGIAAIVIVFFVGLMYASANGHMLAFSHLIKGQVAGDSSESPIPFPRDCPNGKRCAIFQAATTPGSSISLKTGSGKSAEEKNCGSKCDPRQLPVGTFVFMKTFANDGVSRLFQEWVADGGSVCPCATHDPKSPTCQFIVGNAQADLQLQNTSKSAISCFAKWHQTSLVKVSNKLLNPTAAQADATFGTITSPPFGISCSRTANGTDTGVCTAIKTFSNKVLLTAKSGIGYKFSSWGPGSTGGCGCLDPSNESCEINPTEKNVDCVAEYQNVESNPVRASVTHSYPLGGYGPAYYTPSEIDATIGRFARICTEKNPCFERASNGSSVTLTPKPMGGSYFQKWQSFRNIDDERDSSIGTCPCAAQRNGPSDPNYKRSITEVCTFLVEEGKAYDCQAVFNGRDKLSPSPMPPTPGPVKTPTPTPTSAPTSKPPTSSPAFPGFNP